MLGRITTETQRLHREERLTDFPAKPVNLMVEVGGIELGVVQLDVLLYLLKLAAPDSARHGPVNQKRLLDAVHIAVILIVCFVLVPELVYMLT